MRFLASLENQEVEVQIWGPAPDGVLLAAIYGILRRPDHGGDGFADTLGAEEAIVFHIGPDDTSLSLWPTRFETADERSGRLTVTTRDGLVVLGRRSTPWVD